ncbi:MAG: nitroreductase/quinone reductase family protein [Ktedonobacterales bacterium]
MKTLEQRPESAAMPTQAPAPPPDMKAVNPFVRLLLRSPLHFLLSNSLLLLTYTGRKSGKRYTIPVSYAREGNVITVFTHHAWWKNLKGGAPVQVEIKRVRRDGTAEAISDDVPAIAAQLLAQLRGHPMLARSYHVPLDRDGQPDPEAVRLVAQHQVMVRIQLAPSTAG